mgnify:CR=1 FL=1
MTYERLVELVSRCLKVLEECDKIWIALGTRNPNKCRDLQAQSRRECVAVYSNVYETYCRGRMHFGQVRSIVGHILSTYRDVHVAADKIIEYIRRQCGATSIAEL